MYIAKKMGWLFLIIIIGAILGGIMGEIIGLIIPAGKITRFFLLGPNLEIKPSTWNLIVLTVTFGFNLKINVCSVMGIISAALLFRKI